MSVKYNNKLILPLRMIWKPNEDITTYELAQCIPYIFSTVMPYNISEEDKKGFLRHFEIIDPNE